MSFTTRQYEDHDVRPGRRVQRLSSTRPDGTVMSRLFLYSTGLSFYRGDRERANHTNITVTREEWDGKEDVNVYNGD